MGEKSKTIATVPVDTETLDSLRTPQQVAEYFSSIGVDVADNETDNIKTVEILKDKSSMIGVPFLIIEWRFAQGDYGDEFVSAECMTREGRRFILNDGGAGIRVQLKKLTAHREAIGHPTPRFGRIVSKGLRVSRYEWEDGDGQKRPAETYYLDW